MLKQFRTRVTSVSATPAAHAYSASQVARSGDTCWRLEQAQRVSFLVDAADYFRALRSSIIKAERSIALLGWDVHSRTPLLPGDPSVPAADGWPVRLGDLLLEAVRRKRRLRVHLLVWDFGVIFALDREVLPLYRLPWRSHRRLRLILDADHPPAGCHHQKLVVIDDKVAFCGGIDVTASRWDTREHSADPLARIDPDGRSYRPFHDVQMAVDGPAAAALGELARTRWHRATKRRRRPSLVSADPWPAGVEPDLRDVAVAIARTEPGYRGRPEIREIERLYLASIEAASRVVYIENQYLTSAAVADAIARSLAQPTGPEFVIVLPFTCGGWLEETAMGVGRTRILRRLREVDIHGRLAVYYPKLPDQPPEALSLHSKLMVVDDTLLRIGSSNLSNRSLSLDTECDLAIEANGRKDVREAIMRFRNGLIAEHSGCSPDEVADAFARSGSAIEAIESLRRGPGGRSLERHRNEASATLDSVTPDYSIIDPPHSTDPESLATLLRHEEEEEALHPRDRRRIAWQWRPALSALLVFMLAVSWASSSLAARYDLGTTLDIIQYWRDHPAAILFVTGTYLLAGLTLFPITVLNFACGILFGPFWGTVNALAGSLVSACFIYSIGERLGRARVRFLAGPWLNQISCHIGGRGFFTVLLLRLAPMAPFSTVNLVIGASRIGFRSFLAATIVGLGPGVLAMVVFGDQFENLLRRPSLLNIWLLLAAGAIIVFVAWGTKAWVECGPTKRSAG
ncbi:MAG TPA: VTT domain-containing protein [Alphaproteobacteria bacterium]|nr:VTT domain-containing protein [Alphaproteobacteria bacterium]